MTSWKGRGSGMEGSVEGMSANLMGFPRLCNGRTSRKRSAAKPLQGRDRVPRIGQQDSDREDSRPNFGGGGAPQRRESDQGAENGAVARREGAVPADVS